MEKVKVYAYGGEREALRVSPEEWDKIYMSKELYASFYVVQCADGAEKLMYERFTCWGSWRWGGTCRCINHEPREWVSVQDWHYVKETTE